MLARAVTCVALLLPFVCSSAINNEINDADPPYFIHPIDINRSGGISSRIMGGTEVKPHSYPFQVVYIVYTGKKNYHCAGSLFADQRVLTAAHCLDAEPDYVEVILGAHRIRRIGAVVMYTIDYVVHPRYDKILKQNDIAVIMLPEKVTFTANIQPIEIASGSDQYEGETATMLGWGQTEWGKAKGLRSVNATVMNNDDCANTNIFYNLLIQPTHICTSGVGQVGACSGDSGGPLIVDGVQVGIVSFGSAGCKLELPSVFTRVTEFEDWIWDPNHSASPRDRDGQQVAVVVLIASILQYFIR